MIETDPTIPPEERLRLLLEAASDYAIFFTDAANRIIEWSHSAEIITGYSETEALALTGAVIFVPEDQANGVPEREMATAARDGQANDERWHQKKDGTRFFAVGRLIALRDEEDTVCGFVKILRDATQHKTLEEALRLSDEQFRATFAQAPIGMALANLDGHIQQVNAAFCRLTSRTAEELEQYDLVTLTVAEDRAGVEKLLRELLEGRREYAITEKRLRRGDGSFIWVQNSAALLRATDGRPLSFIDLCQDISVMKLSAEELERLVGHRTAALQAKTKQMEAFCYTIAHDLRAPLRAIAGFAEFLREECAGQLPAEGVGYIEKIETAAARLDRLISDLLGYTRIQQIPVAREEVDLDAVIGHVLEHVGKDHRGEIRDIVAQTPLGRVHADAITLEHVFLNLVSNAVKFHRTGVPAVVRIRAERVDSFLRVWVEDNGIGIDPRFRNRVFGMFERVHPDLKVPGTGVGLAIVATAMERLGGRCGVESNSPTGSRFWVDIPA
jgi:PAS domain S-box-containing protein